MSLIPPPASPAPLLPPAPPGAGLPSGVAAARLCLYIASPMAFLVVLSLGSIGQHIAAVYDVAGLAAAAVLVFVGTRVRPDHGPSAAPLTGAAVRRGSRWGWTDMLAFLPATLAAVLITDSLLVGVTQALDGGLTTAARTAVESFAQQAAFYAAALIALLVLLRLRRGLSLRDLGWRMPRRLGRAGWWPWLPIAVVAAGAALLAAEQLGMLAQHLLPSAQNTQCTAVRDEYGGYVGVAIPLVCVIAPLAEETIFRGFFYGWLRRHLPVLPAVAVCAAVFAVSHAVLVLALPLFAVGVVLALLYEYSESLIPGALVHAMFNLVGIIAILSSTATC